MFIHVVVDTTFTHQPQVLKIAVLKHVLLEVLPFQAILAVSLVLLLAPLVLIKLNVSLVFLVSSSHLIICVLLPVHISTMDKL